MWLVLCFQRDLLVIQTVVFKAATAPLVSRYFYFVDYQLGDTKPFEEEIYSRKYPQFGDIVCKSCNIVAHFPQLQDKQLTRH